MIGDTVPEGRKRGAPAFAEAAPMQSATASNRPEEIAKAIAAEELASGHEVESEHRLSDENVLVAVSAVAIITDGSFDLRQFISERADS